MRSDSYSPANNIRCVDCKHYGPVPLAEYTGQTYPYGKCAKGHTGGAMVLWGTDERQCVDFDRKEEMGHG